MPLISVVKPWRDRFVSYLSEISTQKCRASSAGVTGGEGGPCGAESERVAAFRPPRAVGGPPGEGVEMGQGRSLRHELAKEQGRGDGAGEAALGRIAQVGDVGREHLVI